MQPTGKLDDKAIFNAVRVIDSPDDRRAHLRNACGHDIEQRNRVAALLQRFEPDSPFLESPASELHRPLEAPPVHEAPEQIGPYRIRKEIGEGGMGVVYLAQQSEPVRRKVALKVIKPGMDSRQVIARFEAERQALAVMNHSGIAGILDAGMTDEGRPFFVMEFVPGTRIDKYCDDSRLPVDDRLKLLVDVCQAVQHAHQKGIIHRDLKPSNILVTRNDGMPAVKIIDFGIAKALDHDLTEKTLFTHASEIIGTPAYMSPEQIEGSGLNVDTRSDVYSLGVVLYKLLAGVTPFDKETLSSSSPDEMRRMICQDNPLRPSRRISTLNNNLVSTITEHRRIGSRQLSLSMRRELDWVVMKALEKDRLRRYDSVGDLAADVQRHLDGNVVLACPPSVGYRLRKLVRRNKGLLTTGVLLVITLLIATGVSVSYAIQADQRLAQSRRDSDRALNSLGVVVEQLSSAEFAQIPGVEDSRDAMLQQALSLYEEIVREHNDDPYARQQQALAYGRMSNILDLTGRSEEAETAINQGIALLEERLKTHPNNRSYRKSLAKLLFRRIHLDGRTQTEQLADAGRMLPIYQQLLRPPSNQFVAAVGLARLKIAERLPEDSARAMELIAESIRLPGEHGLSPHPASYIWLAEHAERHGDFPEAEKNYRRGIEGYDANATAGNRVTRGLQAYNCGRLAKLLNALGRFEEGRDFHLRAIGYARNLYEQYGKLPEYEGHVAWYVGNYFKDATTEQQQQEALKLLEEFTVKWPEAALLHSKRADCLAESDDAMAGLSNAIEQFPQQYIYCRRRSVLYLELDEFELALADLKQATDAKPDYYHTRYQLAVMSLSADDRAAYDDACQKMLTDFANSDVPDEMHFAAWTCALTTDAVEDYAPAISLARHCADGEPNHRQFLNGLGAILMRAGKYAEARTQLEKGLAAPDSDSTSPAYAHYFLAMTEHHQGHQQAATQQLQTANHYAEQELSESPIWNRRLTLQLLRTEAEQLIGKSEVSRQ